MTYMTCFNQSSFLLLISKKLLIACILQAYGITQVLVNQSLFFTQIHKPRYLLRMVKHSAYLREYCQAIL